MTQPPLPDEFSPSARPSPRRVDGRWIVAAIVALAVGLGLVGMKFRRPSPTQPKSGTPNAATQPGPSR